MSLTDWPILLLSAASIPQEAPLSYDAVSHMPREVLVRRLLGDPYSEIRDVRVTHPDPDDLNFQVEFAEAPQPANAPGLCVLPLTIAHLEPIDDDVAVAQRSEHLSPPMRLANITLERRYAANAEALRAHRNLTLAECSVFHASFSHRSTAEEPGYFRVAPLMSDEFVAFGLRSLDRAAEAILAGKLRPKCKVSQNLRASMFCADPAATIATQRLGRLQILYNYHCGGDEPKICTSAHFTTTDGTIANIKLESTVDLSLSDHPDSAEITMVSLEGGSPDVA